MDRIPTGIGLIVYAKNTRKIFTLRELYNKPSIQKKAGMISFPLETMEQYETPKNTMERLMTEELGTTLRGTFCAFFDVKTIIPGTQTAAYYIIVDEEYEFTPTDTDIEPYGWITLDELLSLSEHERRKEVAPIIKEFQRISL